MTKYRLKQFVLQNAEMLQIKRTIPKKIANFSFNNVTLYLKESICKKDIIY